MQFAEPRLSLSNDNTLRIWRTPTCSNRARRTMLRWSTYCRLQIKMKNKI